MAKNITREYRRNFEIDIERFPAVVFESDDWGTCSSVKGEEDLAAYFKAMGMETVSGSVSTLETAELLESLFQVLRKHLGKDGVPAVFTAFTNMGNPDFAAIEQSGFSKYFDIPLGKGFPPGWNDSGCVAKTLQGFQEGVWQPEYHALLHHNNPELWLERLRGSGAAAEKARALFRLGCFSQCEHLPEYTGYDLRQQYDMIDSGFSRFEQLFGYTPNAAICSDAFPETELLWALRGAKTICLKNFKKRGTVIVYHTKPWNNQDPYAKIGDVDPLAGVAYLTRNASFGPADGSDENSDYAEECFQDIMRNFCMEKEPAVVQTHRANYTVLESEYADRRLAMLDSLLRKLSEKGVHYLTSGELGDLYRQGWSTRKIGGRQLLRKWSAVDCAFAQGVEAETGKTTAISKATLGSFWLCPETTASNTFVPV